LLSRLRFFSGPGAPTNEHALNRIDGITVRECAETTSAERLTRRELEVVAELIAGASNKQAGRNLGISPRTVEIHRARVMAKLGARNAADLVRIALERGLGP
jgi:DNA-binding CsgD family transcriptional regulator